MVVQGFPPLVNLIGVSEWMYEMVAVEKCDCAGFPRMYGRRGERKVDV